MLAVLLVSLGGSVLRTSGAEDWPALAAPLAAKGLLLDVTRTGDRLVAVGDHGVILTSDDHGASWLQSPSPVSAMLTAVSFADADHGWAVGHGGVVLQTGDRGATWTRVALANTVAGLGEAGSEPPPPAAEDDASLLDVLALTPQEVLIGGAYGVLVVTRDGGKSWERISPPAEDLHINRLTRGAGDTLYLAGEMGMLAVSHDRGASWEPLESPYDGSFYGLHELDDGRLLAHGLRGHVFVSDDAGGTWTQVAVSEPMLIATAARANPADVVLGALGGHLFFSRDGAKSFAHAQPDELGGVAELVVAADGALIAVGENGVRRLEGL